jgi:hypothetical protein
MRRAGALPFPVERDTLTCATARRVYFSFRILDKGGVKSID